MCTYDSFCTHICLHVYACTHLYFHDLNAAHVLKKCSEFHLFVVNKSPVIQVHWQSGCLAHLRNRHLTATETVLYTVVTHNRCISEKKSVRNRLRENGLHSRRPYFDPPLTLARRLRRMAWLTAHAPRRFPMRP